MEHVLVPIDFVSSLLPCRQQRHSRHSRLRSRTRPLVILVFVIVSRPFPRPPHPCCPAPHRLHRGRLAIRVDAMPHAPYGTYAYTGPRKFIRLIMHAEQETLKARKT